MRNSDEIFFHYVRYTKAGRVFDRNDYVVEFEDGQKQVSEEVDSILDPHKGITIAFQAQPTDLRGISTVVAAYARCHTGDKNLKPTLFNKKDGRGEALTRLNSKEDIPERLTLVLSPSLDHWSVDELTTYVRHSVIRAIKAKTYNDSIGLEKLEVVSEA